MVKRYIADVATCVDVTPVESVSGAKFVLASDYAALEAENAKLRAGQEPVALQVVAHTQGNLMKSIGHFTDCRTDEGVTVGLIDTIINSARLLATRNLNHPVIVEAIKDLCGDSDVLRLISPQPSAGVVMPDVSAMAKVLSDRSADACNIDRDDNWAMYSQEYIDDVQAMLEFARLNKGAGSHE